MAALKGNDVKLEEPNDTTYAAMVAVEEDEDMSDSFDSIEELMEALNA